MGRAAGSLTTALMVELAPPDEDATDIVTNWGAVEPAAHEVPKENAEGAFQYVTDVICAV